MLCTCTNPQFFLFNFQKYVTVWKIVKYSKLLELMRLSNVQRAHAMGMLEGGADKSVVHGPR